MKRERFRFVPRRLQSVLLVTFAAAALVVAEVAWAGGGQASPHSDPELVQWVNNWGGASPDALHADGNGPFGARRVQAQVVLERYSSGVVSELRRVVAPVGYPAFAFVPELVRGESNPELFWQNDYLMHAEHEPRHAEALGYAAWESYSASRSGNTLFSVDFGIWELGASFVTVLRGGEQPIVAELRRYGQGVWAPKALISGDRLTAVFRGVLSRPLRGYGIAIETMSLATLRQVRSWQPALAQFAPPAQHGFGDPAACMDEAGNPHWVSVLWTNGSPARPTGRIVVDGVELAQLGAAGLFDWLPEMVWVRGRGLMLLIVAPSGNAQVGLVQGNQFVPIAELPATPPEYQRPPINRIASSGESYYISTSAGLWAHRVVPPVGASGFAGVLASVIALGAFALMAIRRRGVER